MVLCNVVHFKCLSRLHHGTNADKQLQTVYTWYAASRTCVAGPILSFCAAKQVTTSAVQNPETRPTTEGLECVDCAGGPIPSFCFTHSGSASPS